MRKLMLAIIALLLTAGVAWAQSNVPPDLAEAARKARAARAKKGAESRMFTNDSLAQLGGAISSVGETGGAAPAAESAAAGEAAGPAAAAGGEAAAEGEAEGAKKKECDDECWRGKFREQRDKINNAKRELDILQREYNLARTQYYQDPNQAVREQYSNTTAGGRDLQRLLDSMAEKQREIAELERGLSTLEDELRRAGGAPGLARE
jgi:hypothetical protein